MTTARFRPVFMAGALLAGAGCAELGLPEFEMPDLSLPEVDLAMPKGLVAGQRLPDDQIAVIKEKHAVYERGVRLAGITSRAPAEAIVVDGGAGEWGVTRVMPGTYDVLIEVRPVGNVFWDVPCADGRTAFRATLVAEAGHVYRLDGAATDDRCWAWIADSASGAVVAGEVPPAGG